MIFFRKRLVFKSTKPVAPPVSVQRDFVLRLLVAFCCICVMFRILAARFYYLQVIKHKDYTVQATTNRISLIQRRLFVAKLWT